MSCSRCELGQTPPVHLWDQVAREHSTNPSRAVSACEASDPSIQLLLASSLIDTAKIPYFSGWGWQKDNTSTWQPLWTTLDDASVACTTLLHCGCNKACTGRCKCNRAGVRCMLCKCEGGCFNNEGGDD